MIDWLNSFSFEAAARLVHPLVVLAVLALIHLYIGYAVGGPIRVHDKKDTSNGDEFSVFFGVACLGTAITSALLLLWWMWGGVSKADGLTLAYFMSQAVLLTAVLSGSFLYRGEAE